MPASMGKELDALPNYGKWSKAIAAEENVTHVFDEPAIIKTMTERLEKSRAEAKSAAK